MQVRRIHIWTNGDPSVGIGGQSVTSETDGDYIFDTNDKTPEDLEDIRQEHAGLYSTIWGEKAHVRFDYELEAQ